MSWKDTAAPVLSRMPAVVRPESYVPFRRKLGWTAGTLALYSFLANVMLFGVGTGSQDILGQPRSILSGGQGTVLQLGIDPIVTASIVLQLLQGGDLFGLDTDDSGDQILYQGLQKLLVFGMIVLQGLSIVFAGGYLPADPAVASALDVGTIGVKWLTSAQIFAGDAFVLFMDEAVSKWGVGSGVGLFIIAGVSQRLVGGLFANPVIGALTTGIVSEWVHVPAKTETVPSLATASEVQTFLFGMGGVVPFVTTLLIFGIVVYAESVCVEIPSSHARVKDARGRLPVKLTHTSVLPIVFVHALQANAQFVGRILNSQWVGMPAWLGRYTSGQVISGLSYYLNPIHAPSQWMWWSGLASQEPWQILVRVATDLTLVPVGGVILSIFWVETADIGPEVTARQIQSSGMQTPDFRRSPQMIERVMERYIP